MAPHLPRLRQPLICVSKDVPADQPPGARQSPTLTQRMPRSQQKSPQHSKLRWHSSLTHTPYGGEQHSPPQIPDSWQQIPFASQTAPSVQQRPWQNCASGQHGPPFVVIPPFGMACVPGAQQRFTPTALVQTRLDGQHSQPRSSAANDPAGDVPDGQHCWPQRGPRGQGSFFFFRLRFFLATAGPIPAIAASAPPTSAPTTPRRDPTACRANASNCCESTTASRPQKSARVGRRPRT
jgi:hypothetical protein